MSATAADTIDVCQARLHGGGFSIGNMAVRTAKVTMWVVFAHRGGWRIRSQTKARKQAAAWREAVWLALGTNGVRYGSAN